MSAPDWLPDWRDASAYPVRLTDRQWRWQFLRRCENYQRDFESVQGAENKQRAAVRVGCRERYGVMSLIDPAIPTAPPGLFIMECPWVQGYASAERHDELEAEQIALISFDLKRPLAPQLKEARLQLEVEQRERVGQPREQRNHRTKWARYLRVLDAKVAGARSVDIVRVLDLEPSHHADGFDPERLVSETVNQAHAVQLRFKRAT